MAWPEPVKGTIAFQGLPGAYSDLACRMAYPGMATLPCASFETAMEAVREGTAALAMLPCENSLAGRVPDIHHLLPGSGLFVIAEHFQRVEHCLLGVRGAAIGDIRRVHSHAVALGEVRHMLKSLGLTPVVQRDMAGSAELVAGWGNRQDAAVASALAAEIYGLDILAANPGEGAEENTTRFLVMAARPGQPAVTDPGVMTTFVFRTRNVPAALYKAMGGFATNGVNITKLESYMLDGEFTATQFLCDADGHPEGAPLRRALEDLAFFSSEVRILGVYRAAAYRLEKAAAA